VIFAVLPVKDPARAKLRLSPALSIAERAALARSMYERVLAVLLAARGIDRTLVATSDSETAGYARRSGALVLEEATQVSHSHSADQAARHASALGAATVVSLPIDIPLVTAAEIESLVAPPLPALRIVPDAAGTGTNCLVRTPPLCIASCFGPGSFEAHLRQARERGLTYEILQPPGVVFDVDTPEDLVRCPSR
jgi:2-phospho-L-lactate guanylyltransferase